MSFWGELKRRNVFKVGAAYVIVAWVIVQVANTFFPILHLPDWAVTLVAVLVILGFPFSLLFAWAFELTPEGLKKTQHVPLEESITYLAGQKLNYILMGVIVLGVAYLLFDNFYLDRLAIQTEVESRVAELAPSTVDEEEAPPAPQNADEEKTTKTIAILPFVNLSSDPEQEYFVDGLSEELLNSLAKIPELSVISRTSAFSFKGTDQKIQEIASELGVAHILEGSVRKAGNALRITAQLIRAADDRHLWSETYDRELKDIFEVQEDIAATVANELKVTLGIEESIKQLGGTDNVEAYEFYMIAKGYYNHPPVDNRSLESINKAIALDSEYALAWALKSLIHHSLSLMLPEDQMIRERNKGLNAAKKAIELEPKLPNGYKSLGTIESAAGNYVEAGFAYRKTFELAIDPTSRSELFNPIHYWCVGYLKRAKEGIKEGLRNDPLNITLRGFYIQSLGLLGDLQQSKKEYEHAKSLFDEGEMDSINGLMDIVLEVNGEASPKNITEILQRFYNDEGNLTFFDLFMISVSLAYSGEPKSALDAINMYMNIAPFHDHIQVIWSPIFHDARQLPRFKDFVREIGLVDYWEKFGWPDLCRPTNDGNFVCD